MLRAKCKDCDAGIATLIFEKINSKSKTVTRDKEGHCILKKGSVHQEDKVVISIYAPISELLNK